MDNNLASELFAITMDLITDGITKKNFEELLSTFNHNEHGEEIKEIIRGLSLVDGEKVTAKPISKLRQIEVVIEMETMLGNMSFHDDFDNEDGN